MSKISFTNEQRLLLGSAQRILGIFEIMLGEEGFELVLEGENMFFQTKDKQNAFRLADLSTGKRNEAESVLLLPRTTDSQDFIPVLLDGKEPVWR